MRYHHILLAVDFDSNHDAIGQQAVDLARLFKAHMHLLHVVEYVPVDPAGEGLLPPPVALEQELIDASRKQLTALAQRLHLNAVTQTVRVGSIKAEIVAEADAQKADLIIIGRHQRHGLALFRGSTQKALVNAAPCDVLAVRVAS